MNKIYRHCVALAVAASLGLFGACGDGAPGPAGAAGTNGTNGTSGTSGANGTDGSNGANGTAYDQAAKYGKISVHLEGTRPDGVDFTYDVDYKFSPDDQSSNEYDTATYCDSIEYDTNIGRLEMLSNVDGNPNDNYAYFSIETWWCEGAWQYLSYEIKTSVLFPDENKYFDLDVYNDWEANLGDTETTGYTLTPENPIPDENGHIQYVFTYTDTENSSGHDLIITATVDATVLTAVNGIESRSSRQAKVKPKRTVTTASMQSM